MKQHLFLLFLIIIQQQLPSAARSIKDFKARGWIFISSNHAVCRAPVYEAGGVCVALGFRNTFLMVVLVMRSLQCFIFWFICGDAEALMVLMFFVLFKGA